MAPEEISKVGRALLLHSVRERQVIATAQRAAHNTLVNPGFFQAARKIFLFGVGWIALAEGDVKANDGRVIAAQGTHQTRFHAARPWEPA